MNFLQSLFVAFLCFFFSCDDQSDDPNSPSVPTAGPPSVPTAGPPSVPVASPNTNEDDDDDDMRLIGVRIYLQVPDDTPSTTIDAIDVAMDSVTDDPDRRRQLQLRSSDKERNLACALCRNWPPSYKGCWVKYTYYPRCKTKRELYVHRKLAGEAVAKLDGKEQRRYLQLAQACQDALDDTDDFITAVTVNGTVPSLPANSTFVEECLFEEIDD